MARPSNVYVAILVVVAVLLFCTTATLIYLLVFWQSSSDSTGQLNRDTCLTPECVALGASVSKSINLSVDPCQDFYEYACGNFGSHVYYKFQEDGVNLEGVNYVETMTAMRYEVLDRLHEVLTVPPGDGDTDPELESVYRFTRMLYHDCQAWWQERDGSENSSAAFVDSLLTRLLFEPEPLPGMEQETWLETLLARIASSGVGGLFKVTVPNTLVNTVLKSLQPNSPMNDLIRVHIGVNLSEAGVWKRLHIGAWDHLTQISLHLSTQVAETLMPSETIRLLRNVSVELLATVGGNRNISDIPVTKRVRELKAESNSSSGFRWAVFFDQLLAGGAQVDDEALVSMTSPMEMDSFLTFLAQRRQNEFGRRATQALLVFDWLLRFRVFLPAELSAMLDEAALSGAPDEGRLIAVAPFGAAIGRECLRITRRLLQPVVEGLYRRAYLPGDFGSVQKLISWVKAASAEAVRTTGSDWMTAESQVQVAEKILAVRQAIGFEELPPFEVKRLHLPCISRHAAVSVLADGTEIEPDFAAIYYAALCAYTSRALQALTTNFSVPVFATLNPLTVNAYNYFHENRIIFPIALLQPPLYHPSFPAHANVAGLGFIAGHEIGHAFDAYGHTLRKDGVSGHMWDEATEKGYLERIRCLKDDYSTFTSIPNLRYDTMDTLSNDVADVIGVSAAYAGLKAALAEEPSPRRLPGMVASLTPEQLFFVQLAQSWCVKADPDSLAYLYGGSGGDVTHSPNRYRVHGMMRHSPNFAEAFSCPVDSPMNPSIKCTFW